MFHAHLLQQGNIRQVFFRRQRQQIDFFGRIEIFLVINQITDFQKIAHGG